MTKELLVDLLKNLTEAAKDLCSGFDHTKVRAERGFKIERQLLESAAALEELTTCVQRLLDEVRESNQHPSH